MSSPLWEKCLSHLEGDLSAQQLNTWLRPLQAIETEESLRLLAPNPYVKAWVQEQLEAQINQLVHQLTQGLIEYVSIEVGTIDHVPQRPKRVATTSAPAKTNKEEKSETIKSEPALGSPINPLFTFDSYVEGKSNQIARAASLHVAEAPGTSGYNPLFLYGGTGLGKTHLMLAVGNKIKQNNPKARVIYLSSERFVQDMITALRNNAIDQFKTHYRSADALLIDDIQFFAKKERSQEEFFYTFNSLLEGQRQIILTCDRFPKEVDNLDERLQSRLGWGLTVAIEPPELETRVAILIKKAQQNLITLPEDVAFFIAKRIKSNVRDLEGALQRVLAFSRFTNQPMSIDMAQEALKDLLALHQKLVTLESIQKTVAEYFKVRVSELLAKKRTRSIARPRQIAMALAKELTSHSLPEIGESFGGRDHTTVLHACRKVAELKESDPRVAEDYRNLLRTLSS
ncbi:MAG: chromosomal replication initiator protein DnaA [Pseudomonadota bacterium]|uniref:Chromosomal replication initiator protein DnaA n=3 Tax=Methylophaga TaxID=40222 RepID=F5SY96_9GAMM|nr:MULTISPECIES: chromosomal replication initiator protein DnaA [Methylophaga]MEC9411856.1 chromosomal replication initiator protein DnaA [Pseudomonadota bacterium]EGL54141.1 ATPase involved in DNA replication initiation [Methylophaga aminisulfidivorans MP]WVI85332.1 chromosomal replication initiator protein DnaA [Methylophaga thalassica]GLQ00426.1 chromosomal replication initiator protein DnaA [Methylophaga thalassica]HIM39920.1 chromosomal replication initiator protein DnaA [Methylophaga ami